MTQTYSNIMHVTKLKKWDGPKCRDGPIPVLVSEISAHFFSISKQKMLPIYQYYRYRQHWRIGRGQYQHICKNVVSAHPYQNGTLPANYNEKTIEQESNRQNYRESVKLCVPNIVIIFNRNCCHDYQNLLHVHTVFKSSGRSVWEACSQHTLV